MSEWVEIKKDCENLGRAFEAFKTACAEERKAGVASGEIKTKLDKIEADLNKFEESKTKWERALVAMANHEANSKEAQETKAAEYKSKLATYLRTARDEGMEAARKEVKGLSALSGPEGGFWLSLPEIDPTFRQDTVETSPMRSLATVQTISGQSMKGKYRASRFGTGGWVGEQDTRDTTTTGTLGEWEIFAREMYAQPEAPQTLLDDAAVDIESWIRSEVAFEFSILENTAFVSGNGVKRPRGFNTYTETDPGNGAFIESRDLTTSNTLAADDLIFLQEMLKEPYQANATWAFRRATLTAVRRLVTSSQVANYLWQPGLSQGVPSQILGRPYVFMADLPAIGVADSEYPIVYGDFRMAYKVLDRAGITVLRDPFTSKGFVRFYTVKRVGGDVVHFEALKRLSNKT